MQNATPRHTSPTAADARPVARGVAVAPKVDEPTVTLPPVNSRYQPRRPRVAAVNRNNLGVARRGSARTAVGL
ncbi:hypothetical protein ABZY58_12140 [Micromonospora tulbaghiae]|uniref:hypothetical protein n=1 Tax=Micromonospora tulbaghiae TaxID=479978 RepID=UPI0033B687F6